MILGFVLTLRTKHLNTAPRKELKLKKILLMLIGSTLIIFATCGGLAFLHFEVNAKLKQLDNLRRADLTSSSESASVALLQGSFTEAIRRANETVGANGLGCVEVEYNGEKLNSCVDASDRFIVNVLYMPGNKSVVLGTLTGHYASQDTYQELWSLLLKILLWTLIVAFGLFFTFASLIKFLQNEWEVASGKVFGLHQSSTGLREKSSYISEVNQAANSFLQAKKSVVELEAAETIIENAAQVAHDIRSPLCALEAISLSANGLQDKQQRIFKQALSRMRSVCDELSFKKLNSLRPQKEPGSDLKRREKDNEVKENLKKLFEEKSIQAFDSKSITQDISIDIPDGVFLQGLEVTTLIRVLSNLFDNAIEAIETEGGVRFSANLTNNNTWISFHISDNGRGLPPDQLELVGSKGFTFGKTEGNGLGLFNAKQSVESAGGVFVFDSWLGKGSVVEIRLPISE